MLALQFLTGRRRAMATTQPQESLPQRLGQQLLGPLEDALGLVRRYRELEPFQEYIGANLRLIAPACVLILVAAIACGLTPIMLLVGVRPAAALAGLLLAPPALAGSLFVLALVFFSWLEERALARTLGHRTAGTPGRLARWIRKKLRADLGKAPRVPWLLAALFVALPLVLLAGRAPLVTLLLVLALAAAPFLYARFER
jgi:hypothetical protein